MKKTIRQMAANYAEGNLNVDKSTYMRGLMSKAYKDGASDMLDEVKRYFSNVMPPFYNRKLDEYIEKLKSREG